MMRKILLTCLAATTLFACPAFAKIHTSVDNIHDTITYKAIKKIMYFNRVTNIDVMKTIDSNNVASYGVLVKFNQMRKKIIENRAEIVIDDIAYPMKKVVPNFQVDQPPMLSVAYFGIPAEAVTKIADFKKNIVFQFHIKGEKQQNLSLGAEENEELRLMTTLNYDDFDAVNDGKIKVAEKP